jgi:tetratricopeptide (TPR) repeat protein
MGSRLKYDFNVLETCAAKLILDGRFQDAIKIYLFMSDGDPSLDAGYLAERIGQCYEKLGLIHEARFWFGRAVEENPNVSIYSAEARARLEPHVEAERNALVLGQQP